MLKSIIGLNLALIVNSVICFQGVCEDNLDPLIDPLIASSESDRTEIYNNNWEKYIRCVSDCARRGRNGELTPLEVAACKTECSRTHLP